MYTNNIYCQYHNNIKVQNLYNFNKQTLLFFIQYIYYKSSQQNTSQHLNAIHNQQAEIDETMQPLILTWTLQQQWSKIATCASWITVELW